MVLICAGSGVAPRVMQIKKRNIGGDDVNDNWTVYVGSLISAKLQTIIYHRGHICAVYKNRLPKKNIVYGVICHLVRENSFH